MPAGEPADARDEISTYPRKGTETWCGGSSSSLHPISTYPRKGTETFVQSFSMKAHQTFQLIPARGRKLNDVAADVNLLQFQLIPVRGRKPWTLVFSFPGCVISTYPRKGTETQDHDNQGQNDGISTYPRKGTETSAISLDGEWMPILTYPRKGTETLVRS